MIGLFFVIIAVIYLFGRWWKEHTWEDGAPFEGMDADVIERALKLAEVGEKDIFFDLGSGDGRVVIAAAMRGAKAYGVELDRLRVLNSRIWVKLFRLDKRVEIIRKSFYKVNLSKATVVCSFTLPETNEKLKKKLKKELKKGTKVISVGFEFKDWKPTKIDPRGPAYGPLYLYKI